MRLLALAGKIDGHALGNALNQHLSSLTLGTVERFIRIHVGPSLERLGKKRVK